jgi:hypothetical protein
MIRFDGHIDSRMTTEMEPQRLSSASSSNKDFDSHASSKRMAKSIFIIISLLAQIFCVVTCVFLWKDGRVMKSASVISNNAGTSSYYNGYPIVFTEEQITLLIEQKCANMTQQIVAYIQANLTEQMKSVFDFNQSLTIQDYSLKISALSQNMENIMTELNFLTLDNRPATIRNTSLGLTLQGYAIKSINGTYTLITQSGSIISPFNPGNGWVAKGAVEEGNGFSLFMLKRGYPLEFEKWTLSSSAAFLLSTTISYADALNLENLYNFDYDEDKKYGPQIRSFLSNINGLALGNTVVGYGLQKSSMDKPVLIYYEGIVGGYLTKDHLKSIKASWLLVGAVAEVSGSGYLLFWKSATNMNIYATWSLNSTGHFYLKTLLSYSDMLEYERMYNYDILKDGRVGVQFVEYTAKIGSVTFGRTDAGYYGIKKGSDPIIFVTSNGALYGPISHTSDWIAVGAQSTSTGYNLFWIKNPTGSDYGLWTLDFSGAYISGGPGVTAKQFFQYEKNLKYDLTGNGIIGG